MTGNRSESRTRSRRTGPAPLRMVRINSALIDNFAANDGHDALRLQNLRRGNFHDVVRENGEISEFADFDRAFVVFFESGVGGVDSKHLQRLLARDGLLGMPPFARRRNIGILPVWPADILSAVFIRRAEFNSARRTD